VTLLYTNDKNVRSGLYCYPLFDDDDYNTDQQKVGDAFHYSVHVELSSIVSL
jgi:hypothetical protein